MQKKSMIVIVAVALALVAAIAYVAFRLNNRLTDIIGVTTLPDKNTVIMNSKEAGSFVSGSGKIIVGENGQIRVDYAITGGSCDIAFHAGSVSLDVFEDAEVMGGLSDSGDVFGVSGVSGTGNLNLAAESGEYTVYILTHDTIGTATVTAPER